MSDFIIEKGVLIKYLGRDREVTIPEGVKVIGMGVFQHKSVASVTMPDTVVEIGLNAFYSCQNLEEVTFSRNLQCIYHNAFRNCMSLARVELFEGLESIGGNAFDSCVSLKELILPEHHVVIGDGAFRNCFGLADGNGLVIVKGNIFCYKAGKREEFRVPEGVRQIPSDMHWEMRDIHRVFLPASVQYIGDGTFREITRLDACTLAFDIADPQEARRLVKQVFHWHVLARAYLDGSLTACDLILAELKKLIRSRTGQKKLLEGLLETENPAPMDRFLGLIKKFSLEELDQAIENAKQAPVRAVLLEYKQKHYTPEMVEQAAQDALDKEWGLMEKTLSDWRKELAIVKRGGRYVITRFKEEAVEEQVLRGSAPEGVEVTIPGTIGGIPVEIGEAVFRNCDYVKTVILQEGVTAIGDFAFSDCRRLRDVYIPASVTEFGETEGALYAVGRQCICTIHAPAGSMAEAYAKKRKLPVAAE